MKLLRTFSRFYPKGHRRTMYPANQLGTETFFVQKILKGLFPNDDYYPCKCGDCNLNFMSCVSAGGWQIAETGDYSDPLCPKCFSSNTDNSDLELDYYSHSTIPKYHTIRKGNHFNVGDILMPRSWTGNPYNSKQIIIAPDITITGVWDFKMNLMSRPFYKINGKGISDDVLKEVVKNDGLDSIEDFEDWFCLGQPIYKSGTFEGQIICWNKDIKY